MNNNSVGDNLVRKGFITKVQLDELLAELDEDKELGDLAVEKGVITEAQLGETIAKLLNCEFVDLDNMELNGELMDLIPEETARRYGVVPLFRDGRRISYASNDPMDFFAAEEIKDLTGCMGVACYAAKSAITRAVNRHYVPMRMIPVIDGMKEKLGAEESPAFIEKLGKMFGLEVWDQKKFVHDDKWLDEVFRLFEDGLFEKYICLPLEEKDGVKWFAVPNPADFEAYEAFKEYYGKPVAFKLASRGTILRVFRDG
ncbi:MAG: hypothetical protein K6B74_11065 [Ruminococcus sp.]|nr:hypothetical protein [Ruminococcus sp.]